MSDKVEDVHENQERTHPSGRAGSGGAWGSIGFQRDCPAVRSGGKQRSARLSLVAYTFQGTDVYN